MFGDEADLYKIEDIQMNDFGNFGEVTITKDDTLMVKVCGQQVLMDLQQKAPTINTTHDCTRENPLCNTLEISHNGTNEIQLI